MIELTEWQQDFVRKHIRQAIMLKQDNSHTEINKFDEEFEKAYPSGGVDEEIIIPGGK